MKDTIKAFGFLAVGLLTAVIIYPLLHETGHTLAAIAVGARIKGISLFPIPYLACEVSGIGKWGITLIGFGGMLLPFALSLHLHPKSFWCWYANTVLRLISLLSFIISVVSVILYFFGYPAENDDITKVLRVWNNGELPLLVFFLLLIFLTVFLIVREKPLKRLFTFLGIEEKTV